MFRQAITIYNRYENPDTGMDDYKRTVIDHAHWEATEGVNVGGINFTTANTISVVIPLKTGGYVEPSKYVGVGWTLKENDYIVRGKIDKEIKRYADLEDESLKMVISSYEINDYGRTGRLNNYTANGK